ncbi:MAG: putative Ig domain-containing protein, partial [Gammaproteobacteria bacterium]|nr:putative Ig domain-containing protein [Gammaproteobacteria bacterium]
MHLEPPFDPCGEPERERGPALALLAAVALLFAAPTAALAQTTLVSNAGENRDNFIVAGDSASGRITQRFTTGSNAAGYGLSSVGIHIHGDTSSSTETMTVSVHRFDSSETNNLGGLVATLSTPSTLNEGAVNDFRAPGNTALLPNTRYLVNIATAGDSPYDFQIGATHSGAETGAAGWLIENAFRLNGSLNSSYAMMMNVEGTTTNNPPTASNNTVTTNEDTAYTFAASDFGFADTDSGDALASVTITTLESAGDLELDGADVTLNEVITKADIDAGKLTFTPAANANGTAYATFRFTVSDGADGSASSYTMTVDVTAVNDPPTVANAIPDQSATAGTAFTYQFAANTFDDVDDNTLTYTAVEDGESALPSWLSFDAGTRTFSGTPASADVGTVTVKVTASDDDGASVSDTFDITVNAAASNPASGQPGITGTPQVGQTLTATVGNINDTDGLPTFPDDYRFQWVQVDGGTETDIGTDSHEYAPPAAAIGKAIKVKVTFNDTDGNGEGPLESDETAAVVAMQEDCATDRPGNDWCATMTVGVGGGPTVRTYGFRSGQGALSHTAFDHGGTVYTLSEIIFVDYRASSAADGFDISISDYLPRGSEFDIGGATLAADASSETTTIHSGSGYSWDAANPGWIDGQKVTVSANLAPVVTAAEVNSHQLVLTFAEDLDANSKPVASAFTVYVNGGAGTNPSRVDTIRGKTVTMTLASAVTSGQTVTLDYTVPETNPLRDESELNAPAFTGRTVTNNTPANNAPTAADNTVTTDEDTAYTFAASDFNFADADAGDTLASVTITTLESAGDLDLDGTDVIANQVVTKADIDASKLTFTPAENANGSAYATF